MNPMKWKREHQLALVLASALGFLFGMMFGIYRVSPYGHSINLDPSGICCDHLVSIYWFLVSLWGIFGVGIAAAIVYIRQLLRA
jgi:hypothetical protein